MMNEATIIARSLVPVRVEAVMGAITGMIGTMLTLMFGGWNDALQALAAFMLIDYVTGVMAAYMRPHAKLSSKRGLRGIIKKLSLVTFVVFAHWLDVAVGQAVFCTLVTYSMLGNEGLSIIENLSCCGVPIPSGIQDKLEQLTHEKHERSKGAVVK